MPSLTISLSLKSRLRSSTRGDSYGVLGFDPSLVFDFKNNYFRKSATNSTFPASITHAATTNATMVDSDGLLKWRPHNNLTKSNTFDTWTKSSTVVDNAATGPNGVANTASVVTFPSTGSYLYNLAIFAANAGNKVTLAAWVRSDTITSLTFATNGRSNPANNASEATLPVTPTWTLVSFESTVAGIDTGLYFVIGKLNPASPVAQIGDFEIYGAQMFRSDLGGMVNNPDRGDSYVPTTTAPVYLSRRGHHIYNGSAWVNEGILHESEARTNLLTYSTDFTNAAWSKTNMTATANQATGPDGTVSATEIAIISIPANSYAIQSSTISSGTLSYFAKQNTEQFFLIVRGTYTSGDWAIFDLSNGTVSKSPTRSGSSAHMVPMGNGWYRCVLQSSQSTPVNAFTISGSGTNNTTPASGTVYLYGAQFEQGSTPSSYIPTAGATVTRSAETLTVPAANLPYDSTNMSIQMDGKMTYADTSSASEVVPYYWRLNSTNYIYPFLNTQGSRTGEMQFYQRQSTSGQDFIESGENVYSPDTNVPFNIASRHGSTFINGAHEGTLLTANTTPTILPDLSTTDLLLGYTFMGTIGQFRMWDEDITDAGITEAST